MRIDGFIPTSNTTVNNNTDLLNRVKIGDTVRAQVIENSGNELTLKLSDGTTVLASAMSPVEAGDGEFVNFIYKGTVDGKPALEVTSKAIQPQADQTIDNIKATLTALKLPVTDSNIQIALALKGQNLQINAENMIKIADVLSRNVDLKPDSAAFLTAKNMPNDQNSIEKLQNLLAGRLKIGNDIAGLVKLLDSNASKTDNITTTALNKNSAANTTNVANTVSAANTSNSNNPGITANVMTNNSKTNNTIGNNINIHTSNVPNGSASNINSINVVSNATNDTINLVISDLAGKLEDIIKAVPNNKTDGSTSLNTKNTTVEANIQAANKLTIQPTPDGKVSIPINVTDNNIEEIFTQISNVLKGSVPLEKADLPALKLICTNIESMIHKGDMQQEQLISAKLIAKEITEVIFKIQDKIFKNFATAVNDLKNLVVKIDQNSEDINPVKLYKDMDEALQSVKNSTQQLPLSIRETAMNIVNNLESNMNFINQLNNYSSYVQLPLSIFSQNTTGELYMLKKGSKSRKLDPSNLTVLISLDSNNIGRIDTLLSIDKKNISTNFRLENSDVFKVLKENHKKLYNSLLEKGFRLVDFTYRLIDEPINILNFESEAKKEFIRSSNNLDIMI